MLQICAILSHGSRSKWGMVKNVSFRRSLYRNSWGPWLVHFDIKMPLPDNLSRLRIRRILWEMHVRRKGILVLIPN